MSAETMDTSAEVAVLVVDDDTAIRKMVIMALEDADWDVLEAKDGPEALATLRSCASRLVVLLDWKMPEMSGEDVLLAVQADRALATRHAYVLMTGNAATLSPHLLNLMRQLPASVMAKPFRIQELLGTVENQARRISAGEAAT
jgi:DNA-binding NtrC family response regulator